MISITNSFYICICKINKLEKLDPITKDAGPPKIRF